MARSFLGGEFAGGESAWWRGNWIPSINSPESFKLPVGTEGKNETGILSKCLFF